jgi:phospholipid/cholesterol/gamma-HCH transport system substrate-binding protein
MESRASYFLVGLFVLTLIAGAFGFGLWLTKAQLKDENTYYYIYFRGSVTGLQVGSQVRLRGVAVGSVTDIAIDEGNVELVQVTIAVKPTTPVKTDTYASLQLQGITGLSYVQLAGGTQGAPALEPRPGKKRAVIPATASPIEKLFENAPELIGQLTILAGRAVELLNEENQKSISTLLTNGARLSDDLVHAAGGIEWLLAETGETLTSVRETAASFRAIADDARPLVSKLGKDSDRLVTGTGEALDEVRKTARSFERLAGELERLVAETREPVRDFAQSGLYELSQFLIEARSLVAGLQRLSGQLERDPARFLFGDQTKGVEAK